MISASTRVAGVIGDPVRHSLSPLLHNAAYEALGLDWVYVAFEVPSGRAAAALDAAVALGLVGLSVTMPHKADAARRCDRLTAEAARLGAVNTVTVAPDGLLHGDSTDGEGFLRSLRAAGHDVAGARVLVLGAGGAARAVAAACAGAGAQVTVDGPASRRRTRRGGGVRRAARTVGGPRRPRRRRDGGRERDTPVGMAEPGTPLAPGAVGPGQVYVDLIYHPRETEMMVAAAAAGAEVVGGLGMLVHQAALQVERWTGRAAPLEPMRAAVDRALATR
ncbi:MAG: hypothetical protein KatS3mg010_0618 [Acidimicrobiia bacterium]|nr:MAG: hypothetical protein KatS3mg010_0618 [Acidimicrobiia bacterium]